MKNNRFDKFHRHYDDFTRFFKLDNHEEIINLVQENARGKQLFIADIGGGTGLLADELLKLGHKVTIIDPARKMTTIASHRNPEIKVLNLPFEETSFTEAFDLIILKDCFHHTRAQDFILDKIYLSLKKNGLVLIQEFLPQSLYGKLIFTFERLVIEKSYPVTPQKLYEMMGKANFKSEIFYLNKRDYLIVGVKNE
ncbi:MAG: class I SAM-dependent methyltransferase [Desulfitobacteriia bacterium]|jgi:ubiquinone/menaquinone biosynthesis C-methylase UbiE